MTRQILRVGQGNRTWQRTVFLGGFLLISCAATSAATWAVSRRIPLDTNIVRVLADPHRPWLYAVAQQSSDILFINRETGLVQKRLYVGKDPTDCDIDITGNLLYVANKGPGTGILGSWRIGVVELTNQTLIRSYITSAVAVNVTAGRAGRLYYNSGFNDWNSGDAHVIDTDTGVDLGSFSAIKTRMVISNDKTRLYGQYIYDGNLGAMGVFNVAGDQIALVDSAYYSPYPYGWDYDNYCLSGDNQNLSYGMVLFNPTNLLDQRGLFEERIFALNTEGSVAFGETTVWDSTTFVIHGDATRITSMPFPATVMNFDDSTQVLHAYNPADGSLYAIEQATANGIPFRWLTSHGLGTNDAVEIADADRDGLNTLQEWLLDSNPTNATPALFLEWLPGARLRVQHTSTARFYVLERTENLGSREWEQVALIQGSGNDIVFDAAADTGQKAKAFYRVKVRVY